MNLENNDNLPVIISESHDITMSNPPAVVLEEAKKAAVALRDVIAKKSRPVMFNGEQYLEFEDWQTVGRFYGITAKVISTAPISMEGATGFEARAVAYHVASGREISGADSMCLTDEKNWAQKPLFQLRSMAQTRACAKALRNVLAWVVVLAGYKPTPYEEMSSMEKGSKQTVQPQRASAASPQNESSSDVISEAQRKRLFAIYKTSGLTDDQVKDYILTMHGYESSKDIKRADYESIITWCEHSGSLEPGATG